MSNAMHCIGQTTSRKFNSLWVGLVIERSLKYASREDNCVFNRVVVSVDRLRRYIPASNKSQLVCVRFRLL